MKRLRRNRVVRVTPHGRERGKPVQRLGARRGSGKVPLNMPGRCR
ncbi:hypothetical protein C7S14_3131 [Burkholderia cepacia]|nr:hypothetical protein C7S14_3131 [Burkholderia cepacia]